MDLWGYSRPKQVLCSVSWAEIVALHTSSSPSSLVYFSFWSTAFSVSSQEESEGFLLWFGFSGITVAFACLEAADNMPDCKLHTGSGMQLNIGDDHGKANLHCQVPMFRPPWSHEEINSLVMWSAVSGSQYRKFPSTKTTKWTLNH